MKFIALPLFISALNLHPTIPNAFPPLKALYYSLDPTSISQLLAFYELYGPTEEGQAALKKAWQLLTKTQPLDPLAANVLPLDLTLLSQRLIDGIVSLINRDGSLYYQLSNDELLVIERLGKNLANRALKGHDIKTEAEVFELAASEVDLGRALLLSQLGSGEEALLQIRNYEAMLDLMSLQVLAKLLSGCSPEDKIQVLNQLIFEEMHFRFPPQSQYAKDIDLYTFCPLCLISTWVFA